MNGTYLRKIKQMEAQELYNDLLDKAQEDLFKEVEVLHEDKDEAFEQGQDDLTISTLMKKLLLKKKKRQPQLH